ncbi:MAG: ABC transporter permease subunit [Eubacteriales bacterium]|nr:ABC transporter permease subunit [Eubacteriales bacterium]
MTISTLPPKKRTRSQRLLCEIKKHWLLVALVLPGLIWCLIFRYGPMYGLLIAFQRYRIGDSIMEGRWAGLYQFIKFFNHPQFGRLISNTLYLSLLQVVFVFPIPILFALLLNEMRHKALKSIVQTVSYLPHFVSTVAVASMLSLLLSPTSGIVNRLITALGGEPIYFLGSTAWYRFIYIFSDIWQTFGFSSIIYIAALTSVPMELYESANIDGASRFKQIQVISLPCIMPTIIVMLILKMGGLLAIGHEKSLLLQSPVTYSVSDIISTFTYRLGLEQANYSFGTAVGLFTSVINCILMIGVNAISRRVSETSLW